MITFNGIRNLRRIEYWRAMHGMQKCKVYIKRTEEWFADPHCGVVKYKDEAGEMYLATALDIAVATCANSDKIEFHFIKEFMA